MSVLNDLVATIATGGIQVIDLTQTLDPDFPQLSLPPEFGQCQPFRIEEISQYYSRFLEDPKILEKELADG